jgi:alpha-D-xyloside xylohydrolase
VEQWPVYLPAHENGWIDFWSGEKRKGGTLVEVYTDIQTLPLFVKAGSILPLGAAKQYTSQPVVEPVEIRIYPGADASFTLYEDEGDNYHYEKGQYSTIALKWDEAAATLTLGKREGTFPGMEKTKTFRLVLIRPFTGTGPVKAERIVTITYTGKKKNISFK